MDEGDGACPGTAHKLRTVAQTVLVMSRIVLQVLRDNPTLLLLPTAQQTPNPPLSHKGLTRGSGDLGWPGAQPAITAVLEGFQMRARLQFSELEQRDIFINT